MLTRPPSKPPTIPIMALMNFSSSASSSSNPPVNPSNSFLMDMEPNLPLDSSHLRLSKPLVQKPLMPMQETKSSNISLLSFLNIQIMSFAPSEYIQNTLFFIYLVYHIPSLLVSLKKCFLSYGIYVIYIP